MQCKNEWVHVAIILLVLMAVPFLLNWVLQWRAVVPVIGDEVSWLAFWGTYIGAILTAWMVYATFKTIQKTVNLNKAQWRKDWLDSFRAAAADMIIATDRTFIGQICQDILFGRYDRAVEQGHAMEIAIKRSSFVLTTVLDEHDEVFDAKRRGNYVKEMNSYITPFLKQAGEIIQFAILCKYMKEKVASGHPEEGLDAISRMKADMEEGGYLVIVEAIRYMIGGGSLDDAIHDAVVKMQTNLETVNIEGLETLLLSIGNQTAKVAYKLSIQKVKDQPVGIEANNNLQSNCRNT